MRREYKETPAYGANLERIYMNPHKRLPMNVDFYRQAVTRLEMISISSVDKEMVEEACRRADYLTTHFIAPKEVPHVRLVN